MILHDALDALLAATLAPPCAACGHVLDRPLSGAVCGHCWTAIVSCPSTFLLNEQITITSLGPYEGTLRDVIHALKYDGRRSVARPLGELLAREARVVLADAHFVVPVPLHQKRQRERGFNQSAALAAHLGVPVLDTLRRTRPTPPQVGLDAVERRDNVRDAFAVRRSWLCSRWRCLSGSGPRPLEGTVVVLVDDVATTGATLEACARPLRSAGAADVRAVTAARVET